MRTKLAIATLMAAAAMLAALLTIGTQTASATNVTILSEGFEDDSWYDDWNRTDHNSDSGSDYWGGTTYRSYAGSRSAWCAQVGSSSVNALPNYVNHYYDQDMQAALQVCIPDLSGYDTVTLTFEYWASTGTTVLNDYLEVRAWMGFYWQHLWKQPTVSSGGWSYIALSLPLETTWVSFTFVSDDSVGLGPYEGVYIDSVLIYGWDDTPPVSSLDELDEYHTSSMMYLTYTAVDAGGSGVQHVELYYRVAGTASYTKYATEDNADGYWKDAHIPFDSSLAAGDGEYHFYIVATDNGGNEETATVVPQASITIDTEAPETVATYPDPTGDGWWNASFSMHLIANDETSGVTGTWYRIDSENWSAYTDDVSLGGIYGMHNFSYYSEDLAGNKEGVKSIPFGIDGVSPQVYLIDDLIEDGPFDSMPVTIQWLSDDSQSGVAYTLLSVDDRALEYFGPGLCEAQIENLEDGEHLLRIIAVDEAGNVGVVETGFFVDTSGESHTSEMIAFGWVIVAAVVALLLARWIQRREQT